MIARLEKCSNRREIASNHSKCMGEARCAVQKPSCGRATWTLSLHRGGLKMIQKPVMFSPPRAASALSRLCILRANFESSPSPPSSRPRNNNSALHGVCPSQLMSYTQWCHESLYVVQDWWIFERRNLEREVLCRNANLYLNASFENSMSAHLCSVLLVFGLANKHNRQHSWSVQLLEVDAEPCMK